MVYLGGVREPRVAIGTSALAVAANALIGLNNHARKRNVKWRCAAAFAIAGVLGAWFGAMLGKTMDGQKLLALFALLMLVVAGRSEEHTSELQSLMRISYAVFCLKKTNSTQDRRMHR